MHSIVRVAATVTSLLLLAAGCGGSGPKGVPADQATQISLLATDFAELEIPADSRGGVEPPEGIPLGGPWKYAGTTNAGMHKWTTAVPIRPRGLFFHNPQPGMKLTDTDGNALVYDRFGKSDQRFWSHNKEVLTLYAPQKGVAPEPGDYTLHYPRAVEREQRLNFSMSGHSVKADFVRAEMHHDWDTRRGLLLPAPARAAWDVTIPQAAELLLAPGLVMPEVLDGAPSDGATLVVSVEIDGEAHEVDRRALKPGDFAMVKLDLSQWAGASGRLVFQTETGATSAFDYVFVGEPILASRKANPRRVVLVFVDTLRPDHMSLYGHERDTTAPFDAWAESAAVFENARSVAPWTLPSARTVLTGRHPEYYSSSVTLQRRLSDAGWGSAMFAGNVYLSTNFEMARDWGMHRVGMWPRAEVVTQDALDYLDAWEGHDVILQVHYMDPHLPYLEPAQYRFMYAGDAQGGLREEFHLSDVRRANPRDEATRQYIRDRYDNNIRYATDEIMKVLARLDDDDVVVFYADHGEEFWDHGRFEHGHHLFDELLRVPLVIKAPGVQGRRIEAPASLLDITPTVLDALGMVDPEQPIDGVSLLPAARGQGEAELSDRDLAFGRPLYGGERWGVLTREAKKWTTHEGREALYDLTEDRQEQRNLIANMEGSHGAPYRDVFAHAMGTEIGVGYRLVASNNRGGRPAHDLVGAMHVPGGVKAAWVEHDPLNRSSAEVAVQDDGDDAVVVATWHRNYAGQAVIWVVPNRPLEEVTHGLEVTGRFGEEAVKKFTVDPKKDPGLAKFRTPLGLAQFSTRVLRLTVGIAPIPHEDMQGVSGHDPEMERMLIEMGYSVGEENINARPEVDVPGSPPAP